MLRTNPEKTDKEEGPPIIIEDMTTKWMQVLPAGRELGVKVEGMGKVWLVGAGPSDPGLMTLKGKQLLEQAQVVVYDALVSAAILAMIPNGAELIYVGKRAGNHPVPQEQINQILLAKAQEGKRVVRLKGGDPFLFGRGGEELELLAANHVPFEVVPGITSALAVPAYNGIPVTHRDYCSSVHIITAHSKKGGELKINFPALCALEGTLVFLMGVTSMEMVCDGLVKAGMDPKMPAAILQEGTSAVQRRVVATVSDLPQKAREANIQAPSVLIVGKVCALEKTLSWTQNRPLDGVRVVLTRPKELVSRMAQKLYALGAEVIELPAICLEPYAENPQLEQALSHISDYQWAAFTSITGVRVFFDFLREHRCDLRALSRLHFAAIGPGTAKELEQHGIFADLMPERYYAKDLAEALAAQMQPGQRVLLPRARIGSAELTDTLQAKNIAYTDIPLYDTVYTSQNSGAVQKLVAEGKISCVTFTSASTVKGFAAAMQGTDLSGLLAACIGEKTAQAAREAGMKVKISRQATIDSLCELLVEQADSLRLNRTITD